MSGPSGIDIFFNEFSTIDLSTKKNPERTDILFTNKYSTPPETHSKEELASFFRGAIATVLFACAEVKVEKSNRKKKKYFQFHKGSKFEFLEIHNYYNSTVCKFRLKFVSLNLNSVVN